LIKIKDNNQQEKKNSDSAQEMLARLISTTTLCNLHDFNLILHLILINERFPLNVLSILPYKMADSFRLWELCIVKMISGLTLYSMGYGCSPMGKQCRSRSACTSMPSDQDLCCFLLIYWVISDQEATVPKVIKLSMETSLRSQASDWLKW
jgi:hypothetical protein